MAGKQKVLDAARPTEDQVYMARQLVWLSAISQYVHPGELVDLQHVAQDEIDALLGAGVVVAVEFDSPQAQVEIGRLEIEMDMAGIFQPA